MPSLATTSTLAAVSPIIKLIHSSTCPDMGSTYPSYSRLVKDYLKTSSRLQKKQFKDYIKTFFRQLHVPTLRPLRQFRFM